MSGNDEAAAGTGRETTEGGGCGRGVSEEEESPPKRSRIHFFCFSVSQKPFLQEVLSHFLKALQSNLQNLHVEFCRDFSTIFLTILINKNR